MPELPEVEAIRCMLSERVEGRRIIKTEVLLERIIRQGSLSALEGQVIRKVERIGKFLCFRTNSELQIYCHMRMSGTLRWEAEVAEYEKHVRAVIRFEDGCLIYNDPRTLGGFWISGNDKPPWRKMGLDPFDLKLTAEYLLLRLKKRRTPIKTALLDQGIIAGIGNIYASESLFDARIDPRRPAQGLALPELGQVISSVRRILQASIKASGTTFRDFRLSDGQKGRFSVFLKVYGKAGETCKTCGTVIERTVQAQRSTFFCPKCQAN